MAAPCRDAPWACSASSVCQELACVAGDGLAADEVLRRRAAHGPNRIPDAEPTPAAAILARQLRGLTNVLLAAAAAASFAFGEVAEGLAIAVVILLNVGIGFFTEVRAVRSMEALRQLGRVTARVRREGKVLAVGAEELVPGDVVVLEAGEVVPADLRVIEASRLQANESQLTGESLPVDKKVEAVPLEALLPERACMLYRGSSIVRGSAAGAVVASGAATEVAKIAALAERAGRDATPLELNLKRLGNTLAGAAIAIGAVTAVAGAIAGHDPFLMVETGIALAVAAIPEAMPIMATLTLARGLWRMARRRALINRLSAVETLGAVTTICTDKTGTLTENRMTVVAIVADGEGRGIDGSDPVVVAALRIGALCSNAALGPSGAGSGDPLEVAFLVAAAQTGIEREGLLAELPEVREEAFDSTQKMMATVHEERGGGFLVAVKGAPESVLAACERRRTSCGVVPLEEKDRQDLLERQRSLAGEGYRVLALAERRCATAAIDPYRELTWVALALLEDPPRRDVAAALAACRAAGIDVVMVTGDQAATARTVGRQVGLLSPQDDSLALTGRDLAQACLEPDTREHLLTGRLFARVDPAQKLALVRLYQEAGEVVAMTGDGVNDAPALRQADIGIAMGLRGSQVAREAADVILEDDSFATIAVAIREGRVILDNIQRFMVYLFSCNASEVLLVVSAALLGAPLPVLPLQLLFLNLVTDVFPALALGLGEGDAHVMARPPRDPREPLLTRAHWLAIAGYAATIALAVLGAMLWCRQAAATPGTAPTVAFLTLAFAQVWHVFDMRSHRSRPLANEVTRNPYVWAAVALCSTLLIVAVEAPPLAAALHLSRLGPAEWRIVVVMSLLPVAVIQAAKLSARLGGASNRAGDRSPARWGVAGRASEEDGENAAARTAALCPGGGSCRSEASR